MIKTLIRCFLPKKVKTYIFKKTYNIKAKRDAKLAYKMDERRYTHYSTGFKDITKENLLNKIIREYHVIEKGLTMPETKLGFGKVVLCDLINDCKNYINKYGLDDCQIAHAIAVVYEYEYYNENQGFIISEDVKHEIINLKKLAPEINKSNQREITIDDYFEFSNDSFSNFSKSRHSVRNFSKNNIPIETIHNALRISANTPSACNRQSWRTYVYVDKEKILSILEKQGGNRGFGHLVNKLIIITEDLTAYNNIAERNQAYIDGGMYAMNLVYALHYLKIATCILNCSHDFNKEVSMRELCSIKESEVFIVMIACGSPPLTFRIASSPRYSIEKTNIDIN